MKITSPAQIDGAVAKALREQAGHSQREFWGSLGIGRARGCHLEKGRNRIDEPIKRLIYLHHVCGLPLDLPHDTMLALAETARRAGMGIATLEQAIAQAETAIDNLKRCKALVLEA